MRQRHALLRRRVVRRLNQSGKWFAWLYEPVERRVRGGYARSGPTGQPDIYAIRTVTITPEMVGATVGLLVGIEVKVGSDRQTVNQQNWQRIMEHHGAVYRIMRFTGRRDGGKA